MNPMEAKLDFYVVRAFELGYLTIQEKNLVLTDAGKKEMDSIAVHCVSLMMGAGEDITSAARKLSEKTGENINEIEVLKIFMGQLIGTEARLLAFFLNERDNNYKYVIGTLRENPAPSKSSLSVVPKKKYDA